MKTKRDEIGKIEGGFIVGFYCFCVIAGVTLGFLGGIYIFCLLTGNPFDMHKPMFELRNWLWLPILGIIIGGTCIGVPLFVLCIKPFYTRQVIIDLVNRYPAPYYYSKDSVDVANGIGWFWFNFFYPEEY